jgi:PAS domain S-box-containing protein
MGSAAHAATAVPEPPQAAATLAQAVDDSTPSAAHLRHLLDTLPILASCHLPDGSNAFCNHRWHDYTGLAPEDARSWGWHVTLHPDDLGRVRDMWRTCLVAGEQGEVEGRLRRFDGVYRWFLFRAALWRDAVGNIVTWYSTATDIDDLKRAVARLRQDERAHACCDRAHLFSLYTTGSEDKEASPFFLRHRKGNICHRAHPARGPTEAKRARAFFPVVPFLESQERRTAQACPVYRHQKSTRSDNPLYVTDGLPIHLTVLGPECSQLSGYSQHVRSVHDSMR